MDDFVTMFNVCDESVTAYVVARHCKSDERVYMKPKPNSYDFKYVYKFLFKEYDISFPLTDFEVGMLTTMNLESVVSQQLGVLKVFWDIVSAI